MRFLSASLLAVVLTGLAAANAAAIPDRIGEIKPGEWVMMTDVAAAEGEKTRISVIGVGKGKLTLRREHFTVEGAVAESREQELDVARLRQRLTDLEKRATSIAEEFVMIGEKRIPVVAVQWEGDAKDGEDKPHEYKVWLSRDLPITGLAKFWSSDNGIPHAEIIDYGFGSE